MKFAISVPDKLIPSFLKADRRALQKFEAENKVLQDELTKKNAKGTKRVAINLTQRRLFRVDMQMDTLKLAIELAKDPIRPRRDFLYSMYDECWDHDGHTIGETRKAILKAVGSPFGVFDIGSPKDAEPDEKLTGLLEKKWFRDYRKHFHEKRFWGHSLVQFVEMVPSNYPGMAFEFKKVELIPRQHVRPEEGFIVIDTSDDIGIPFREDKWKNGLMLMEMGDPKDLGLLRIAVKEYIWKNYSRSDWSRYSEKFGMPIVVIKTATRDGAELDKMEKMASTFGQNLWMLLDSEDDFELLKHDTKDSSEIYEKLANFSNTEISKAISGATGTSDEKAFVGSAKIHETILNEFVEEAKRDETDHNNEELFPFLMANGYPFEGKEFRYLAYQSPDEDEDDGTDDPKPKGAGGSPAKKTPPSKTRAYYKYRMT
jgi:hypothetical protein